MKLLSTLILALTMQLTFVACSSKTETPVIPQTTAETVSELKTVQIGNQIWTAENLNIKTDSGSWCYDNNEANAQIYGRLYNWETAKKLCPQGFRLPTFEDWNTLFAFYGAYDVASTKLKAANLWGETGSTDADSSIFKALPGGMYNAQDSFFGLKYSGYFWTATEAGPDHATYINLDYDKTEVLDGPQKKIYGFSVRYIKN